MRSTEILAAAPSGRDLGNYSGGTLAQIPVAVVIEDDEGILAGFQMLFESWGCRVVACSSANRAVEMLRDFDASPTFIISDYQLKNGLTGLGAIALIQQEFGDSIPAILVTGDTGAEQLREVVASGLPIFHKPINSVQLKKIVSQWLS